MQLSRYRKWAKWVGLVGCTTLAAFWLNGPRYMHWVSPASYWLISFCDGCLDIQRFTSSFVESLPLRPGFSTGGFSSRGRSVRPFVGSNANSTQILIPLWIPFIILAIPTAFFWYRDRRPPPNHCQFCGYNLTGNVSGTCPECGERV